MPTRLGRHPGDVVRAVLGVAILTGTAILVREGRVPPLESDTFRLINDLPGWLLVPLASVMQAGAVGAVGVAAATALLARRVRMAHDLAIAGASAYLIARVVKFVIERGRPAGLFPSAHIRGAEEGLGFPSGHVAVAAALAAAAAPYMSRRARRVVWAVVAVVAVARVYVGAHLPLDAVGGWALGWVAGAGVHLIWGAPNNTSLRDLDTRGARRSGVPGDRRRPPRDRRAQLVSLHGTQRLRRGPLRESHDARASGRGRAVQGLAVPRVP